MKNVRTVVVLLAVPITTTAALAQSSGSPLNRESRRVIQAHCQYTPNDPACLPRRPPTPTGTRCPHPAPCPSPCCPYGYPPPARPPLLYESENGTHAGAGALIGFGIGAVAGAARDRDSGSRFAAALVVGGFGALIGSVIGHGVPSRHWRRHDPDWDDPDENSTVKPPQRDKTAASCSQTGPQISRPDPEIQAIPATGEPQTAPTHLTEYSGLPLVTILLVGCLT